MALTALLAGNPKAMIRQNVADILQNHVVLELEGIDRMYLNGYIPTLQTGAAAAFFIRQQFDCPIASTALVAPMSRTFVANIERFVAANGLPQHVSPTGAVCFFRCQDRNKNR